MLNLRRSGLYSTYRCYRFRAYSVVDCIVCTGCYRCSGYNVAEFIVRRVCYRCKGYSVVDCIVRTDVIGLGHIA